MRVKKPKIVYAFHTTADAIKVEEVCKDTGAPGRIIPVPREISAGCGMAWSADPEHEGMLEQLMKDNGIDYEDKKICKVWVVEKNQKN